MKKIIILFLSLSLLLSQAAFVYAGENSVISISSASDLAKIGVDADYPLDGEYCLKNDITLGNTWTPIAQTDSFTGEFDGNGKTISLSFNSDSTYIFKYIDESDFYNFNIIINGENARTSLAYMAGNSMFNSIDISGEITKQAGQIGGLVWVAYGCEFSNIYSEVDMKLTAPDFSVAGKYNILGGIVCQITAEAGTYPWSSGEYANKFIDCSYSGEISVDLDSAVYGTSAVSTALWTGSLYGATAYDSPVSYYGVYIENCNADAIYDIGVNLNKTFVTQYNYIDDQDGVNVTYIDGNKSASSKTEEAIVRYGRTHQNIHLTAVNNSHTKYSYGYYGKTKAQTNAGEHLWNEISAPNLVSVSATKDKSNGKITGLSSAELYEYKLKNDTNYTALPKNTNEIKNLPAGTYQVRVKTDNNVGIISEVIVYETSAEILNVVMPSAEEIVENIPDNAFTPEQKLLLENGATLSILVETKPVVDTDPVYQEEVETIKNALTGNETVISYVDIDIYALISADTQITVPLTSFENNLAVKLEIPTEYRDKGYEFLIINSHNGDALRIDGTLNSDESYITFETKDFSIIALIVSTSSIVVWVIIAAALVVIIVASIFCCRRRR